MTVSSGLLSTEGLLSTDHIVFWGLIAEHERASASGHQPHPRIGDMSDSSSWGRAGREGGRGKGGRREIREEGDRREKIGERE